MGAEGAARAKLDYGNSENTYTDDFIQGNCRAVGRAIFSSPVLMYRKSYCTIPGEGIGGSM